jgi:hypothetical protein
MSACNAPDTQMCRGTEYDGLGCSTSCYESKMVVNNIMPGQCLNLVQHVHTDLKTLHYEGDKYNDGKWVD